MIRSPALQLMTFLLTAFLSVSSGIIASSDGVITFKVTEALVERGEITLSPIVAENVPIGVGGKPVSRFGLALSLAAAPLYLLGKLVCLFTPEAFQSLALKGSVSLTNAIVSALVCLLLFLTGKRLGYPDRVPLQLTMSFAFTTFFIVNGTKSFLTQTLETLCLAGTLYFLIENSRGGGVSFSTRPSWRSREPRLPPSGVSMTPPNLELRRTRMPLLSKYLKIKPCPVWPPSALKW